MIVGCSKGETLPNKPGDLNGEVEKPPIAKDSDKDEDKDKEDRSDIDSDNDNREQEMVLEAIKEEIDVDFPIKLPKKFPLSPGEYLTAITESNEDSYSVIFFKSKKPIPVNSEDIGSNMDTKEIAVLYVTKYLTQEESDAQVPYENINNVDVETIDLAFGIRGYRDGGAGSAFINWNESRWSFTSRSLTSQSEKGLELAKEAIRFLEENTLPTPHEYGNIHLDTEGNGNLGVWQYKKIVYTLDKVPDPMDFLKIMVSFD